MRVTVDQITFDEFKEAAAAVRDVQTKKQQQQARRSPGTFLWAIAIAVVIFFATLFGLPMPNDPLADRRPPMYTLLAFMLPIGCLLVLALVGAAAQRSASRAGMLRKLLVSMVPLVLFVPLLGALWFLTRITSTPALGAAPPPPTDWYGTFMPHAGWVLITVFAIIVTMRATKSQLRQTWEGQPSVARPKVFDITSSGVAIDEMVTHRRYAWLAFTRFVETANLLLLCPSDLTFEILPKRAIPNTSDLDAVRALFASEIRPPGEAPAAFPVIPTAAAVPAASPPPPQRVG